jgi:type VI secretion system protein ImpL
MVRGTATRGLRAARRRQRVEQGLKISPGLRDGDHDLVAGFTEYFDDPRRTAARSLGVTFLRADHGGKSEAYAAEFDAHAPVERRVFARLDEDRDVRRRARIFAFPQQMAALRDLLNGFITDVFASTRFDQQILLRGVYFTSGTQEGTPIDRLLGAIGRRFAVAAEAVSAGGRGKAYFIERLTKGVMLEESGHAGDNRRH